MARKSRGIPSKPEPPKVFVLCEQCKQDGQAGAQILPYSVAPKVTAWIHRGCLGEYRKASAASVEAPQAEVQGMPDMSGSV